MKMKQLFFLLTSCCALMACSSDEMATSRHTGFRLMLTDGVACETGRAVPSELPKPVEADFSLVITNTTTGREAYNGKFKSEIPVAEGTYLLRAAYGSDPSLAWDTPYYEGTEVATAAGESETVVTLACKVANALLSAEFVNPEVFRKYYSDYGLEVRVAQESLVIKDDGETGSAYFKAQSAVKLTFQATLRSNGASVSKELTADGATYEAGTHTRLSLEAGIPEAGAVVSVSKVAVTDVTVNETLPNAWLPAPKVGHFNGGGSRSLEYVETADAVEATVPLTASSPIEEIAFTVTFNDERLRDLNGDYTLSTLTDEQKAAFTAKGIVLPQLGTTATSFDLKGMTASLLTQAGADVVNQLKVKVRANDRDSEEGTFTITTKKPQFSVNVYSGNVWTKELTVNEIEVTTGSVERLRNGVVYQYSTNQNDWISLSEDRKAIGLSSDTQYYVRAVYRNVIATQVVPVKTYSLVHLTNGSLDAYTTAGVDGSFTKNYGQRFFWDGWSTLNELTCDYCPWTAYWYNTRSGTRSIDDAQSGKAVWIATIGWGYGSTSGNTKIQTPGELFLGTLTKVDHSADTATKTYGIPYASHPTHLAFYYKYIPYDNDKSDIFIKVLHDEEELGTAVLQEVGTVSSWTYMKLPIVYDQTKLSLSPNRLQIVFKSGFNSSVKKMEINKVQMIGSQLFIDEVSLVYDK